MKDTDITIVTYGSTVKIAMEAVKQLAAHDISVELIDVQTLVPFDIKQDNTRFIKEDKQGFVS